MNSSQWRVLRDGDAGLILAVAFDAGRGDARFSDLAHFLGGRRVLEAVPQRSTVAALRDQGADDYMTPWLEAVKERGQPVHAVLGHCGGAVLAREMVGRLRALGLGEPSLVTFDPIVVDGHILGEEYRMAIRTLAAQLSPEDLESTLAAAEPCGAASAASGQDVLPLAETLEHAYRTAVTAACRHVPVAPAVQKQLCDRFSAYLAYLAAVAWAHHADPPMDAPVATTVLSATGGVGTSAADPRGTITRFAVDRTRLLADPEVAEYVSKALIG
ncbi:hypothetical protein ACPXCE_28390 [Streptomyces sp. DT24]|uniref:hypothetical protein n=1 Tax=Streptomyces sp. DT24 TaxID=3416520 RepID=UPI003CFB75C9